MNRGKRLLLFIGLSFLFFVFMQCQKITSNKMEAESETPVIALSGNTMGTTYNIKLVLQQTTVPAAITTQRLSDGVENVLQLVNLQMSTFIPDSEVSRFNRYQGIDWFQVSANTLTVFCEAQRISQLSGGAFDITVGPLVNIWGFGPTKNRGDIPSELDIQEVKKHIGYQKLSFQQTPPALKKSDPLMYCDLSAIAKGYGVDQVAQYLETQGYVNYMVEIGGELRTAGMKPGNKFWHVAIASPDGSSAYQKVLALKNLSMATSGDYHNYFEKDGMRYSHTIDPNSGKPITHHLASVSVVHPLCMTADAIATALDVLGPEKGNELALKEHLPVLMIIREQDGFVEKMTPEFAKLLGETR